MSDKKIEALKNLLSDVTTSQWLSTVSEAASNATPKQRSITGEFASQELTFTDYADRQAGGFFSPITTTHRDASIQTLFAEQSDAGQWLIDYLNDGTQPSTAEQQLFITKYDSFMASMFDLRPAPATGGELRSAAFRDVTRGGETLTDVEFASLLAEGNFQNDIAAMGDPLGKQWVMFTGGVVQEAMDVNSQTSVFLTRYSEEEMQGLLSQNAIDTIRQTTSETIFGFGGEPYANAIQEMNSICASPVEDWRFDPGSIPNKTNDEGIER